VEEERKDSVYPAGTSTGKKKRGKDLPLLLRHSGANGTTKKIPLPALLGKGGRGESKKLESSGSREGSISLLAVPFLRQQREGGQQKGGSDQRWKSRGRKPLRTQQREKERERGTQSFPTAGVYEKKKKKSLHHFNLRREARGRERVSLEPPVARTEEERALLLLTYHSEKGGGEGS